MVIIDLNTATLQRPLLAATVTGLHWSVNMRMMPFLLAVVLTAPAVAADTWTLHNPTNHKYENEIVRLKLDVPEGDFKLLRNGEEVPYDIVKQDGRRWIAVCTTIDAGVAQKFETKAGKPKDFSLDMKGEVKDGGVVIDNGVFALQFDGYINKVRLPDGRWVGVNRGDKSELRTLTLKGGNAFAQATAEFVSDTKSKQVVRTMTVTVAPGWSHALIEERFKSEGRWEWDIAHGFKNAEALVLPWGGGAGKPGGGMEQVPLKPGYLGEHQDPNTLLYLIPRWNQHYKDGWFAGVTDGEQLIGVIPMQIGDWVWPHDNWLELRVNDTGFYAGLRGETKRGARKWLLYVGKKDGLINPAHETTDRKGKVRRHRAEVKKDFVMWRAMYPLDKVVHDFNTQAPDGGHAFSGYYYYSSDINPTGSWRGRGRGAVKNAGKTSNSQGKFTWVQSLLHDDTYGTYWNFTSPQNPNFFTDYIKVPIGEGARLREHPDFEVIRNAVEGRIFEDLYHSVTLPSGAGQECPGYLAHAMKQWKALAPVLRKYYGVDITKWEQYKAAPRFLLHSSVPMGGGKRMLHPSGDTHNKSDAVEAAAEFGYKPDPRKFVTEELQGFGAVFRNSPGTGKETFLSFKAGPNRGHFHGDQLSLHWCADGAPVAVDHRCSYAPRAGQEHMHNRVSFTAGEFEYANMDGYERLVAFKTSKVADVAVGQVESSRLREMKELPAEDWDKRWPVINFDKALVYRRTVVFVRDHMDLGDYFVLIDDHSGPKVKATWNLHVLDADVKRDGVMIDMGKCEVFVAAPATFEFDTLPWSHDKVWKQSTVAARVTAEGETGRFITVVAKDFGKVTPTFKDGELRIGDDVIRLNTELPLVFERGSLRTELEGTDIDLNRSQGEIGLFVPDAGYPFGPIPDWLIEQRTKHENYRRVKP